MKILNRKAGKVLGISMVAYLSVTGATAQATSLAPIYGNWTTTGSFNLYNNVNKVITSQVGQPVLATPVAKIPVSTQFNAGGVSQYTDPKSLTGTFAQDLSTTVKTPVHFNNLNFIDITSTNNIRNQVLAAITGSNPLNNFVTVGNIHADHFGFSLTKLVSAGSSWLKNYKGQYTTFPVFTIAAIGKLYEYNSSGIKIGENDHATFNLTSTQPKIGVNGFNFNATIVGVVPIPAAVLFVGPALAGVFGWSRRKTNPSLNV